MIGSLLRPLEGSAARRLLLLCAFVLFVWNIWGYDLWAPDEPFFGEGAREMIVDGQWLVPHVNGLVNTHKPPLFFWLIALISLPFGEVSSFTARLPSVLAAVVSVSATVYMARRATTERVGLLAGAVLATSFLFWEKAHTAQIDSLLCCLITLALLAFSEFRAGRLSGRSAGVAFWAACALGTLAKGPVGLILPLGTALIVLAVERRLGRWLSFAPLLGPLTFAAIAGAWVLALEVWPVEGYSVVGALREHFVDRAVSGLDHVRPWWYYAKTLPWVLFPWSLLLPGALLYAWRRRADAAVCLALVHSVFVVLFFSFSTEKRELYVLPALPAFAFLLALFLDSQLSASEPGAPDTHRLSRRWLHLPQGLVGGLMVMVGLAVPFLARREYPDIVVPAVVIAIVFLAAGVLIIHATRRARPGAVVRNTCLGMAAVLLALATLGYPIINPEKSGRVLAGEVAQAVAATGEPDITIAALDISNVIRPINFYTNGLYGQQFELWEMAGLLELFAGGEAFILIADRAGMPDLQPTDTNRMVELYETRLSRRDIVVFNVESR